MNRLIKGARFNSQETRRYLQSKDKDLSRNIDLMFEDAGACFRRADPSGTISYLLSREVVEYKTRKY